MLKPPKIKRRTITTVKKGKSDRQKLIKKLDDLVSKIIRERDGACVICGTTERLQNGHLFTRQSYSLRWDLRPDGNCNCQCDGHNKLHEYDPYPYINWYIEKFGKERFDLLYAEHKTVAKFTTLDLELMYQEMKREYEGKEPVAVVERPRFKAPIH